MDETPLVILLAREGRLDGESDVVAAICSKGYPVAVVRDVDAMVACVHQGGHDRLVVLADMRSLPSGGQQSLREAYYEFHREYWELRCRYGRRKAMGLMVVFPHEGDHDVFFSTGADVILAERVFTAHEVLPWIEQLTVRLDWTDPLGGDSDMDVMTAIRERRSIRSYQDREVEHDKLERVLEAARLAPSARNIQEWKFVVVRDPELRRKMIDVANGQKFVGEAPVVIAACATKTDHIMSCGLPNYPIDTAIAITNMTLQAVAEGLGTCWIGAFKQDAVKELLGIPEHVTVVELLPLGYPTEQPAPRSRKPLNEIVCYDGWQ